MALADIYRTISSGATTDNVEPASNSRRVLTDADWLRANVPGSGTDPDSGIIAAGLRAIDDASAPDDSFGDEVAVSPRTRVRSRSLLRRIAAQSGAQHIQWQNPVVTADAHGRIQMLWRQGLHPVLLIVDGAQPEAVTAVIHPVDSTPIREIVATYQAIEHVLWSLSQA